VLRSQQHIVGQFSSFSGLMSVWAISLRLPTAGSRVQTASANGSRPRSRALLASVAFFGLNGG
jgi:hypothetical protein